MDQFAKTFISEDICSEIERLEEENKNNSEAIYSLYVHIVPKELSGYDWDKYYVGITKQKPENRWRCNGNGYYNKKKYATSYFSNAIEKYGWNNIKHIIITSLLNKEQAEFFEKNIIYVLKTTNRKYGYNIAAGGFINKGFESNKRKKVAQYSLDGMLINTFLSISHAKKETGITTIEHCINGNTLKSGGYMWLTFIDKPLDKIDSYYSKCNIFPVVQLSLNNEFIKLWHSSKEASNYFNSGSIKNTCMGYQKTSCGYKWKYLKDINESEISDSFLLQKYHELIKGGVYMTKIMGQAKASAYQMSTYLLSKNSSPKFSRNISALEFCQIFLDECLKENVRGDIAFAQACKETGNFNYGGDVHYTQNNFSGIGATGNKNPGNVFDTIEIGVLAQAQHLKSYACKDELNEANVDPRRTAWFMNTKGGSSPDVETLGGSWAVPGYDTSKYKNLEEANNAKDSYGYQIMTILNNILNVTDERGEMPMTINQLLTPYNYTSGNISRVKYIVIHYVGATGGAESNCKYYASQKLSASAHYFVGHSGEIWQSVEDKNVAWHCGGKKYANTTGGTYHGICTNANSIGIEMCVRKDSNGNWYFEDSTVESTIALTKELMKKYNVPADNVIRHFDVNGKPCGYPYVYNNTKHTWNDFKSSITNNSNQNNNVKKKYTVGWNEDENGWWYSPDGNTYYKSEWKDIKGYRYYFNDKGYALTNWQEIDGKWYFFETTKGDLECALYVSDENGAQAPGKFENKQEKTGTVYDCSSLNVRSKNSTSGDIITSLTAGTKVTILDESNGWYYVSSNGIKGWVSGKYIKLN